MILGSTLFAKYQKMTGCLFIFFRSQTVTGGCHFCKIQKCQAPVIFLKSRNDRWLSFFVTRQNRRWDPHVFRGGAQTHFQTSVTTPEPPMFLEGGLRNKSKMAQIEPNLSPPSKNMGGSGVVSDVWQWVWAPPLKTWGAQRRFWRVEKNDRYVSFLSTKMTATCHFWIWKKWQAPVIFGIGKSDSHLSFSDFKKWQASVIFGF